jgi:hypothetical protein
MKIDANDIARQQGPAGLARELERRVEEAPNAEPVPEDAQSCPPPAFQSADELIMAFPQLRPPVIHGLLREGETMNVIAPSKAGKSWLMLDLAISVAAGVPWLGFDVVAGETLIFDNEMHRENLATRLLRVIEVRGIQRKRIGATLHFHSLRGKLRDIHALAPYFRILTPGRFKLIILDAFYRFLPLGSDENSNADMAAVYNRIDSYSDHTRSGFACVHHASKGLQSAKAITDVGAGAGAMARATDTHLILRPHQEDDAVVLEAVARSWPPLDPICLRWTYPVWNLARELDPTKLREDNRRRQRQSTIPLEPPAPPWTVERFVAECITATPELRAEIVERGVKCELVESRAKDLLARAIGNGQAHVWTYGGNRKQKIATRPQETTPTLEGISDESGKQSV